MSRFFWILLSMSFSGSLLILTLILFRPWLQSRISRQWQYYAWLVVIARLLLPVTPAISLAGNLFQWAGQGGRRPTELYGNSQASSPMLLGSVPASYFRIRNCPGKTSSAP